MTLPAFAAERRRACSTATAACPQLSTDTWSDSALCCCCCLQATVVAGVTRVTQSRPCASQSTLTFCSADSLCSVDAANTLPKYACVDYQQPFFTYCKACLFLISLFLFFLSCLWGDVAVCSSVQPTSPSVCVCVCVRARARARVCVWWKM